MNTFWINDLSILFSKNHFLEVIPLSNMKFNNKLNAIFRLSIYYFIVITLIKKDIKNIFVPVVVGLVTIVLYNYHSKNNNISESIVNNNNTNHSINGVNIDVVNNNVSNVSSNNNSGIKGCRISTEDNPFMNPTFMDISVGNMEESCKSYNNSVVRELENVNYNSGLYVDQFDIYGKEQGNRQFYTVPVNSIVNDQGSFAQWCYGRPPTCKQGNGIQCSANLPSPHDVSGGPGYANS
jgi:hypothetical protein